MARAADASVQKSAAARFIWKFVKLLKERYANFYETYV